MASQITATLPTLDFPKEVDYPTQEDWAAFSAAAELNFGILGGSWSTQMQLWKTQANAMSIELNTNSTIAQGLANYQGDWTSKGYTLGQTVSVSGVYYICKLTHATGQNPTTGGSIYWNIAIGNWNLKVNNYGDEPITGIKSFSSSPIVPTPTANTQAANKQYVDNKVMGIAASSEIVAGVIKIATTAETQAGTDDLRAITPLKLKNSVLGLGQAWQDGTGSRILGANYTNSTGKPIVVMVHSVSASGTGGMVLTPYVNGLALPHTSAYYEGAGYSSNCSFIVPNGGVYSITGINATSSKWVELR